MRKLLALLGIALSLNPGVVFGSSGNTIERRIDVITGTEQATDVSTPPSGKRALYPKDDGWYQRDSSGAVSKIGSGSGGGSAGIELLSNRDATSGTTGWTASGGTFEVTTLNVGDTDGSSFAFTPSAAGQYVDSDAYTVPKILQSGNCASEIGYQTDESTNKYTVQVLDGSGNVLASDELESSTAWTYSEYEKLTFQCPTSGTVKLRVLAAGTLPSNPIYFDQGHLGENTRVGTVAQATEIGSIRYTQNSSCVWSGSSTSSGWQTFATDADCTSYTVRGDAESPTGTSDQQPRIVFNNLPEGNYRVEINAYLNASGSGGTGQTACQYVISDGDTTSGFEQAVQVRAEQGQEHSFDIHGSFNYDTSGARTFEIKYNISTATASSPSCQILSNADGRDLEIHVYRFPTSSQAVHRFDTSPKFAAAHWTSNASNVLSLSSATWTTGSALDTTETDSGAAEAGTSDKLSMTVSNLNPGSYLAVFTGMMYSIGQSNNACNFGIYDGDSRVGVSTALSYDSGTGGGNKGDVIGSIHGVFTYDSLQSSREFSVQAYRENGSGSCNISANTGERTFDLTLIPLSQNLPMPFITHSVMTSSSGQERIERVRFGGSSEPSHCTSSPCTIYSSTEGGVVVTRSATGRYEATFSKAWTGIPSCVCSVQSTANPAVCRANPTSTTATNISSDFVAGSATDAYGFLICMGEK